MDTDTTLQSQEEIKDLLQKALKNIEHAHMDALLEIEKELADISIKGDDSTAKIQLLQEQLS